MRRLALAAVVLALAGCADDGGAADPTTTAALGPPADFRFRPVVAVLEPAECNAAGVNHLRSADGELCYELGPAPVEPVTFVSADAIVDPGGSGDWIVAPVLTGDESGIGALNEMAGRCFEPTARCPTGQVAMVLDGEVLSAPTIQAESFEADQIVIAGAFTQREAEELADQLSP